MKIKNKQHKPFHLHVEHFFRKRYLLLGALAMITVAFVRADPKTMNIMRDAYLHGYGSIGDHMREEVSRHLAVEVSTRTANYSGQ